MKKCGITVDPKPSIGVISAALADVRENAGGDSPLHSISPTSASSIAQ